MTDDSSQLVQVLGDPPWPPFSGGDLRNVAIQRAMERLGSYGAVVFPLRREVDLAASPARVEVFPSRASKGMAERLATRVRATVAGRHPFLERIHRSGGIDRLRDTLDAWNPQVVVLTWPILGDVPTQIRAPGRRVIVDLDTSRELVDRRRLRSATTVRTGTLAALDLLVARRMESGLRDADEVWVVSEHGREDLLRRRPGLAVRVVPNVVDVTRYEPATGEPRPGRFTFVGSLDYGPNADAVRWLVRELLPSLRSRDSDVELLIVGRTGSASYRAELQATAGVRLVSDASDAWAVARTGGPLVVPIRGGGGSRFKIIEAAASGVPIVSTRIGIEGLDLVAGEDYLEAADVGSFADALRSLWTNPADAARLARSARRKVEQHYDQTVVDRIVAEAFGRRTPERSTAATA